MSEFNKTKNRRGRFSITHEFIQASPRQVLAIMGKVIILRAEFNYCEYVFKYDAISELFDPVGEYYQIPLYEITVDANGKVTAVKDE